jgi:hypothetical protein
VWPPFPAYDTALTNQVALTCCLPRQATNFLVVPRKKCGPANGVSSPDPFTPFAVCAGAATSGPCVSTSGEPLFIQDNAGDIALVRANLPDPHTHECELTTVTCQTAWDWRPRTHLRQTRIVTAMRPSNLPMHAQVGTSVGQGGCLAGSTLTPAPFVSIRSIRQWIAAASKTTTPAEPATPGKLRCACAWTKAQMKSACCPSSTVRALPRTECLKGD